MSKSKHVKILVLISGGGTNLQALIDAIKEGKLANCEIERVISNKRRAAGLERAKKAGITTDYHNLVPYKKKYPDNLEQARLEYDRDLAELVRKDKPDLIVCAGFMHILAPAFLDPIAQGNIHIINLHPALPGQFDGISAIERAHQAWLDGNVNKTGVLIHRVISEVDRGEAILVEEIPFIKGVDEDIDALTEKIHSVEHRAIVTGTAIMVQKILEERGRSDNSQETPSQGSR
ncbi:hypothetical protein MMC28_005777 [Mycoblastus sanguinarius]|nr:hypothetical protein [Mycoblastus sanguinarius]